MVHVEVHTPIEPPETEVPIKAQIPDEALDQVRHLPTPKDPVQEETEIPNCNSYLKVPPQPKPWF